MNGSEQKDSYIKSISLLLLTAQGTVIPLLVRYSRVKRSETFLATSSVFFNEVLKLIICVTIIVVSERSFVKFLSSVYEAIFMQPLETLKVCVPSLLYTIQNNLYFVALSNLSASTYSVTYQLKILTTALFSVVLLRKHLSMVQWGSLIVLMAGVSFVQLQDQLQGPSPASANVVHSKHSTLSDSQQNRAVGLAAVLAMCLSSGFGGVWFEKVLKASHFSVWMQNVRLALLGIPLSLTAMLVNDWSTVMSSGILKGYDWLAVLIIVLNSTGGLLIALVIKYADNILKAYSQSLAIVFAVLGSSIWFDFVPTLPFVGGTLLVIFSLYLYAQFPYKALMDTEKTAVSIMEQPKKIQIEKILHTDLDDHSNSERSNTVQSV